MPAKNSIKEYEAGAYYHIYNRGVEKRLIFIDDQDYKTFLCYLKLYLTDPKLQGPTLKSYPSRSLKNYAGDIELYCYCLMSNHFHLLIKQNSSYGIKEFMQSLCTKYSIYFNKKLDRVGGLFQGKYKAVKVRASEQLVYLSKYIHLNPREPVDYPYSSLSNYLRDINQVWVRSNEILSYFSKTNPNLSYRDFINLRQNWNSISSLLID